jgi:hypothetical protein
MKHLIIKFTNENACLEARVGPSENGFDFRNDSEQAMVIIDGPQRSLVDLTARQLVSEFGEAMKQQQQDEDAAIRGHAWKTQNYINTALLNGAEVIYKIDAGSDSLTDELPQAVHVNAVAA